MLIFLLSARYLKNQIWDLEISQTSQKMKIMFHVFRVVSLDFSRNLEARNFSKSLRLYKAPQPIWVESSEFSQVPWSMPTQGKSYVRRFAPRIARRIALLSPRASAEGEARNFSESQGIHTGRNLYTTTRTAPLGASLYHIPDPIQG